ncbi:unnamed protein product [Eretmochelys imbricata]
MGLPREKVPPDGAFRRMCSGQCAEIWRYVTRHVHHQRNVKKIRGNLLRPLSLSTFSLLYSGLGKPSGSEPEQERRQQLAQGVARLRGELQQLDLQTETAQREVMADEVSLEAAQERIRDAQRRSLLLKAYAARLAKERQQLQGSVAQLRGRLEQLKDISRKAKVELTVGGKLPDLGFAGLEPEVLEGWSRCEELWVKQLPLQAREQRGRAQLASLVQVAPAGGGGLGARDPRQLAQSTAAQDVGQGLVGVAALPATLVSVPMADGSVERDAVEPGAVDEPLVGEAGEAAPGEEVVAGVPLAGHEWMAAFRVLSSRPLALGVTMVLSSDLICGTRARSFPPPDSSPLPQGRLLARPYTPTRSLLLHSHPQLSAERGSE